jgi:hypothetical protein
MVHPFRALSVCLLALAAGAAFVRAEGIYYSWCLAQGFLKDTCIHAVYCDCLNVAVAVCAMGWLASSGGALELTCCITELYWTTMVCRSRLYNWTGTTALQGHSNASKGPTLNL